MVKLSFFKKVDAKNATKVPKDYTIIYCHNTGVKQVRNNKYILCTLYRRFTEHVQPKRARMRLFVYSLFLYRPFNGFQEFNNISHGFLVRGDGILTSRASFDSKLLCLQNKSKNRLRNRYRLRIT